MSKELAKKETNDVAVVADLNAGFGAAPELDANDLVITNVQLMQSTSERVQDGEFKLGDMIRKSTAELLGDFDKPIKLLPFHVEKMIYVVKDDGDRGEYIRTDDYRPKFEYEYEENGEKYFNIMNYRVYFLESEDSMPIIINFNKSSRNTGKEIVTMMYATNPRQSLGQAGRFVEIGSRKEKKGKNTWATFTMNPSDKASVAIQNAAVASYKMLGQTKVEPEHTVKDTNGKELF